MIQIPEDNDSTETTKISNDVEASIVDATEVPQAVEYIPAPESVTTETMDGPLTNERPAPIPIPSNPRITVRSPLTRKYDFKGNDNHFSMLNISFAELDAKVSGFDDKVAGSVPNQEWLDDIADGIETFYADGAFNTSVVRDSSDWRQGVEHNSRYITAGAPQIPSKPGSLLTGEGAMLRMRELSKLGTIVHIPLWHSGIWIKLKAPTDADLMELERALASTKTEFGRSTLGSIFSNESVYMNCIVARFALRWVYASSLIDNSETNLANIIRATDIPKLVWGLACVIYSNGYPIARPCISHPRECQHIQKDMLNVGKMSFTDNAGLLDWQKEFMLNPETKRKPEEIEAYQAALVNKLASSSVAFNENVTIHLGVPSISEYEATGYRWIDSIIRMVEDAATKPLEGNAREQYIGDQAKLSRLRKYGHWIKEISLSSDERIVDIPTIEEMLTALSSNDSWDDDGYKPNQLLSNIGKFVDNVTIDVIGIPRYECSNCGAVQTDDYMKHPELIVIDVVKFFFTLVRQRLTSNLSRR